MSRTIKTILLALIAALAAYVAWMKWKPAAQPAEQVTGTTSAGPDFTGPSPFDGLGLRYDGYYKSNRGSIFYLVRFFPEGRAVLINGMKDMEKQLPLFLTRDTQGNPDMGLYNIMADVRGDSIFFTTKPLKGEIDYSGKLMDPGMLRLHRHSHINGMQYDMEYRFMQDSTATSVE